uniref:alanine--tRNA ligase n=1 Tax=Parascaris equorum TaxID=6256 RepID=A0A914RFA3_PAREQ
MSIAVCVKATLVELLYYIGKVVMKVLTASEVRSAFINFFASRGHTYVHSSSVIPFEDPTLLFANAGMNQFKPIFLGTVDPSSELGRLRRAKEVCNWAWELLTNELGIPAGQLYVSYFGGDEKAGLASDDECRQIWLDIGYIRVKEKYKTLLFSFMMRSSLMEVNADDPMVVEIWNLVFMQYNRYASFPSVKSKSAAMEIVLWIVMNYEKLCIREYFSEESGELRELPMRHIDCGLGLERLVAVMQNKTSNYDTDTFTPIFDAIQAVSQCCFYRLYHSVCNALWVQRVRYANEKLGAPPGFFASLVPVVVRLLGDTFPELKKDPETVMDIINDEEAQFLKTLNRGRSLFQKAIAALESGAKQFPGTLVFFFRFATHTVFYFRHFISLDLSRFVSDSVAFREGRLSKISGDIAWRLYDTYGFPVDLTQLMAEEKQLSVDMDAFEHCRQKAVEMSSAGANKFRDTAELDVHGIAKLKKDGVPSTDDSPKYDYSAVGPNDITAKYSFAKCEGQVLALLKEGTFVDSLYSGDKGAVILDRTNFYAEQGGQICDTGGAEFEVSNVQMRGGYVVLVGSVEGNISVGDRLLQAIDEERRSLIMKNHTGTHVLNFALRRVLGDVEQKGSLVAPDKMRFDFSAKHALTSAQDAPLAEAREVKGLRAVFDEKLILIFYQGIEVVLMKTMRHPDSGRTFMCQVRRIERRSI